jgi:uncharacterized Zn finger protein
MEKVVVSCYNCGEKVETLFIYGGESSVVACRSCGSVNEVYRGKDGQLKTTYVLQTLKEAW